MMSFQIGATICRFYKKILKYIALISPQTVIVERYLIVARKTEYASGNSMHLLIEFLLESQASLNKRAKPIPAFNFSLL